MKNEQQGVLFKKFAAELISAEQTSALVPRWTINHPNLTEEDGYTILDHYIEQFKQQGEKIVGYKLGYTSEPMRKQMGIETPCYGYIFERHVTSSIQDDHWQKWVHPKMEPELAVILKEDVHQSCSLIDWANAIEKIYLVAEIVDSRYQFYQFKLPDIIADNNSIGAVVLNEQEQLSFAEFSKDLNVKIVDGSKVIEEGSTQSVMGHPIQALNWLADKLATHGKSLHKGDLIITGGLTKAMDIRSNDNWSIKLYDQDRPLTTLSLK